ncbi:MAG: hypothetical protein ACOWWO_11900 [Peptococcaceae bacterium]
MFTSFDADILAYLHDTDQQKTQGFLQEDMLNFDPGEQGTYSKMWSIAFPMAKLTPARVQEFQDKGLLTWCFCPDSAEEAAYALACGATLLTCNDPVPALGLLRNKGLV